MLPPLRQTLFFSATMAPEIRKLADAFLQNPKEITVSAPASVATTITAGLVVVPEGEKRRALRKLLKREPVQNALIFCNRKRDVDVLFKSLTKHGFSVGALHGDLAQSVRFATLEKFKNNELQLLVCSDVAARGIDIGGLSHVFNFDLPFHAEDYVHRIGRTGRAGREGHAYSIATADDAKLLAAIEALTGREIPRITIEGIETVSEEELTEARESKGRGRGRGGAKPAARDDRGRRPEKEARPRREEAPRRGRRRDEEQPRPREEDVVEAPAAIAPLPEENRRPREEHRRHREEERARPRDEAPREPRGRREDHRRDEYRRDRRDRDDLGPPVVGFGDAVPAFMLIPIPRPRRDSRASESDAA
jgi:superfamily II DNA/RNA helicase